MNKITKTLMALIFATFAMQAHAISISFSAGECLEGTNSEVTTPASNITSSTFRVISNEGNGIYQLIMTGGLPRISASNPEVCIDGETNIGYVGVPTETNFLPRRETDVPATAYFDGKTLIIFSSAIYSDRTGSADFTRDHVKSSAFIPVSNTVFFEYLPESNSFRLTRMIRNTGFIMTTTASYPSDVYMEAIIPHAQPTQTISLPHPQQDIIYKLY
jgi:hypothetical protein